MFIFETDTLHYKYANASALNNLGYSLDILEDLCPCQLAPSLDEATFKSQVLSLKDTDKTLLLEMEFQRKDGTRYPIELRIKHMKADDRKDHYVAIGEDITERIENTKHMNQLVKAVEQSRDIIRMTDIKGNITYVNEAMLDVSGYTQEELIGKNTRIINSGTHSKAFFKEFWSVILSKETYKGIFTNKRKDGTIYYEEETVSPVCDDSGKLQGFITSSREITDRLKLQEKLMYMATTDQLTQISNRHKLNEVLDISIDNFKRYGQRFAILLFDVDDFKAVNDTHGHDAGDKVLFNIAQEVTKTLRKGDVFGRWGGEEFLVLTLLQSEEKVVEFAEKIRKTIEAIEFPSFCRVTISIGATLANSSDTKEQLLKRVDEALYKAKSLGKNCTVYKNKKDK